jgi:filamentous hemagglutinin family protein
MMIKTEYTKVKRIIGAFLLFLITTCQRQILANEQQESIRLDWKKDTRSSFWTAEVNRFDVPSGAVVEVKGPKDGLIRVTGDQPTSINGTLVSSNPIYVMNTNGVVVAPGAIINDNDIYLCPYPFDFENQKRLIKRKNLYLFIIAAFHCSRLLSAEIKEGMIVKVYPKEGVTNVGEVVAKDANGLTIDMGTYTGSTSSGISLVVRRTLDYSYEEIKKLEIIALTNKDYGNVSSNYGFQIPPCSHPKKIPLINRQSQENKTSVDTEIKKKEMELAWKTAYDFVTAPGVERPSVSVKCYSSPIVVSYGKKLINEYLWLGDIRFGGLSESKEEQGSFRKNEANLFPNNSQSPTNPQQNP